MNLAKLELSWILFLFNWIQISFYVFEFNLRIWIQDACNVIQYFYSNIT